MQFLSVVMKELFHNAFCIYVCLKQELWLATALKHQTAIIMLTTKWVRPISATRQIISTPLLSTFLTGQIHRVADDFKVSTKNTGHFGVM